VLGCDSVLVLSTTRCLQARRLPRGEPALAKGSAEQVGGAPTGTALRRGAGPYWHHCSWTTVTTRVSIAATLWFSGGGRGRGGGRGGKKIWGEKQTKGPFFSGYRRNLALSRWVLR